MYFLWKAIARQRQTNIRGWADRLRKTWKK